jgi:hypothetical protein
MTVKGWIWKAVIAGSCGTRVHFLFMYFRTRNGVLPSFQPYQSFQLALSQWVGANVPAIVPWALSFLNGMTILGFLFARLNRLLPGRNGAFKGLTFGLLGWVLMKSRRERNGPRQQQGQEILHGPRAYRAAVHRIVRAADFATPPSRPSNV